METFVVKLLVGNYKSQLLLLVSMYKIEKYTF